MLLSIGTVLGDRYQVVEKIGSGGMAVVYRAKDKKLDRYVTVKVLREEYIGDDEFVERFQSEACSAARLSHPNIVRVYDVGEDADVHFIVMEYIHGDTLKKAIKEKAPFDSRSTINVAIQIASAISQAHKGHIVHRDIKPQNILVGTDGIIKVTDFGIARAATVSTMTTTANAAGSVHYFSPEQARGGYVDEKSDIYSLGITMFEMITGILPFQGANSVSIALKHINEELSDIREYNPNCTPSLEGIIKKATMKKADERYANIDLLLADLIRARTDTGTNAKPIESQKEMPQAVVAAAAAATTAAVSSNSNSERRSRRAEVAAELRAAQESGDERIEISEAEKTINMEEQELDYIRENRRFERLPEMEPLVSFEKYGKRLALAKEDDYEDEYVEAVPVKVSKRPARKKRNPRKEANYENESEKKTERKVILAAIATAVLIIGIISIMGIKYIGNGGFGGFVADEKTVEIPMFIGVTLEEAQREALELGIELVEEGQDFSSYFDTGYVIYQSVGEGTMVASGTKIGIKTSAGLSSEQMPNVTGLSENEANEKIVALIGIGPKFEYEHSDEVEAGLVIAQSPNVGDTINARAEIRLRVSRGVEGRDVVVPNLVGSSEENAIQGIEAVGLRVGTISRTTSTTVEKGRVITQTLPVGQEVPQGSVMSLVISDGPADGTDSDDNNTDSNNDASNTAEEDSNTNNIQETSGTEFFMLQAPGGATGQVYVRVIRNDVNGVFPVIDEYKDAADFPYTISVVGTGVGTVSCYMNDSLQWTQTVNFSE